MAWPDRSSLALRTGWIYPLAMTRPTPGNRQPPGWYPNQHTGGLSYFDGQQWTGHHQPLPPSPRDPVTHPALGWVLLALGALVAVGSFMPWASALGGLVSKSGADGGDGIITAIGGLCIMGVGLAVGLRQGLIWAPITATLLALIVGAVALYDVNDISGKGDGITVGAGLWLTTVGAAGALIAAVCAFAVRDN